MASIIHQLLPTAPPIPKHPGDEGSHALLGQHEPEEKKDHGSKNSSAQRLKRWQGSVSTELGPPEDAHAVDQSCSHVLLGWKPSGRQT